jgi:hypothetical protein
MAKKKVDELFVQMYELKGLPANQALMVNKVWSFQSNGMECYMSNETWANFLGCSKTTVGRIKRTLKMLDIIETDDVFITLKHDMQILIKTLNDAYRPKYIKKEEKQPYWSSKVITPNSEGGSQIEHTPIQIEEEDSQIEINGSQVEHTPNQIEEEDSRIEINDSQVDNQLYNIKDNIEENIEDTLQDTLVTGFWSIETFIHKDITKINQIDFDNTNTIELRNNVLSFWYNCFSKIEIKGSLILFLNETYFNVFTKTLRGTSTGLIQSEYLVDVDINYLFKYIQVVYNIQVDELEHGSLPTTRNVSRSIMFHIQDDKEDFKYFLKPLTN